MGTKNVFPKKLTSALTHNSKGGSGWAFQQVCCSVMLLKVSSVLSGKDSIRAKKESCFVKPDVVTNKDGKRQNRQEPFQLLISSLLCTTKSFSWFKRVLWLFICGFKFYTYPSWRVLNVFRMFSDCRDLVSTLFLLAVLSKFLARNHNFLVSTPGFSTKLVRDGTWQCACQPWGLRVRLSITPSVCTGVVMPVWSFRDLERSIVQSDSPIKETGPA